MQTVILIASCVFCLQTASSMCAAVNNSWVYCGYLQAFDRLRAEEETWFMTGRSQDCTVKNKHQCGAWHEQLDIIDVATLDSLRVIPGMFL